MELQNKQSACEPRFPDQMISNVLLMERMGERMKGITAENSLAKVSTSNIKAYVSCINVDYEL